MDRNIFSYQTTLTEIGNQREWTIELIVRKDDESYYTECYWDNKETGNMLFSIPTLYIPLNKPFYVLMHELIQQLTALECHYVNKSDVYEIFNVLTKTAKRFEWDGFQCNWETD